MRKEWAHMSKEARDKADYPFQQNLPLLVDFCSIKIGEGGLSARIEAREGNLHSNEHFPLCIETDLIIGCAMDKLTSPDRKLIEKRGRALRTATT